MDNPTILPDPTSLHLVQLEVEGKVITATVQTTAPEAQCPQCACRSTRVHSRYIRRLADLPWLGCAMRLELHVRRFFCQHSDCQRQIFTERLPSVVAPYARRTLRLQDLFTLIGFALGGEAGQRLVAGMGLVTSPDILLRLLHVAQETSHPTPRVLGVDDFSFRRRISFGTILIDLEKRVPVDLLPDREAETFAKWLIEHPGVEIISRDRGGDYARGGKQGAPNARQIADRWHLLKNLSESMQSFFLRKQPQLKAATQTQETPSSSTQEALYDLPWYTGQSKRQEEKSQQYHQERVERYHTIHELASKQIDVTSIARKVGLSRQGVYNYLQMKQPPERTRIHREGRPNLDPYKEYLIKRWNEGCRNAQLLYREIKAQGYTGSNTAVGRFIAPWRTLKGEARRFKSVEPSPETMINPAEGKKKHPPTALQVAHWVTFKEDQRLEWQKDYLSRLCETDAQIQEAYELIQEFTTMLRERKGEQIDSWLARVEKQGVAELQSFAQGLRKDYDAVKAGLTLEWSQGPVEGHVHRLKLIKRQAYGRASFQMLRKRVLQCA
ncbi:MAG TPA: ISL3 family transposase [Ktedonobacteraceae bacterium]|nr:ISL3 family transposase [Ktedonobacteraceae bacterium]